jgi:hypothetical protein
MAYTLTDTQGNIASWLAPYITGWAEEKDAEGKVTKPGFQGLLNLATGLGTGSYTGYTASPEDAISSVQNRVAPLNELQEEAIQATKNWMTDKSGYLTKGAGLASLAGDTSYASPDTYQGYMNPYMQGVVEQQKKAAIQDYQRQMPGLQSEAYKVGAGRGTRSALMQSEANRNLQNNLQNIQAAGSQNAWQQGMDQFNAEQNRRLQAGETLGNMGNAYYNQMLGINAAQQGAGATLQGQHQKLFDTAYEDYLASQRFPYQQLGFLADTFAGIPVSGSSSSFYTPTSKPSVSYPGAISTGLGYLGKDS